MKHNPFVPREQRTAILTFDNGQRVRAEITLPGTDKPVWHTELERRIVNDFNKAHFYSITDESATYGTAKKPYSLLIDKIAGKGTWERNPYVFVYEFELIK